MHVHLIKHWDKIFWSVFLIAAVSLILGLLTSFLSFGMFTLLGLILIVAGSGKLSEEIFGVKLIGYQDDIYNKMHRISKQLEQTFNLTKTYKEKTDFRLAKIDERRKKVEIKVDKNYRDLAKKIIDVENKLNKLSKVFVEREMQRFYALGGESFGEKVLNLVKQIPPGKVTTYSEIAKILGNRRKAKAVGNILARSTHLKSIPFHRVVRSDGTLTSIGGMTKKKRIKLLKKEGVIVKKNKVDLKKHLYKFIPEI